MPGPAGAQEQAPALLAPLSDIPQRVAQTQVQEALQFKGLQQALYPETAQFRWTYTGTPTESSGTSAFSNNALRMVPWLVSRTIEVDQLGFFPNTFGTAPVSTSTTYTSVWKSHPLTFYPDGRPILEAAINVPTAWASSYANTTGEHVLEPGLYWVGFKATVTFSMFGARFLPMGVNAMADTLNDLLVYSATDQPVGVLYNAGPLPGADLDISALTWASTSACPLLCARLRPT